MKSKDEEEKNRGKWPHHPQLDKPPKDQDEFVKDLIEAMSQPGCEKEIDKIISDGDRELAEKKQ